MFENKGYGKEIDIWASGVALYELICGNRPFKGENYTKISEAVRNNQPPPIPD